MDCPDMLYTAGEVGTLFGINKQTLHYYDQIGLLRPARREEGTGTRQYHLDQIYQLASIRFMRKLGYSIRDIQRYQASLYPELALEQMQQHSQMLREQCRALQRIDGVIQRKIHFIQQEQAQIDFHSVQTRHFPKRYYFYIGYGEEALYGGELFYFYPTVMVTDPAGTHFGAYICEEGDPLPEGLGQEEVSRLREIPAGTYLCKFQQGPYSSCEAFKDDFRRQLEGYPLDSHTYSFNVLDQFVESDPSRYVELHQIRLLDQKAE